MNFVRAISILLVGLFLILAYQAPHDRVPFLAAAGFFGLLGYLSIRNAGAPDSPFVWWAIATVFLSYSLIGMIDGAYPWRRYTFSLERDPILFWAIFVTTAITGIGAVVYGISRKKHS